LIFGISKDRKLELEEEEEEKGVHTNILGLLTNSVLDMAPDS
jgi:hypothetical protein